MIVADYARARAGRFQFNIPKNGGIAWRTPLIVSEGEGVPSPQAYLIDQDAHSVSSPHYHTQNQFQLMVAGAGVIGRHTVGPIAVHYAQRESGYGPIVAGDGGLSYLTLRRNTDRKGSMHLPEKGHLRGKDVKRRMITIDVDVAGPAVAEPVVESVIAPHDDHLAAWLLRLPAGGAAVTPRAAGAGRFYVVASGGMAAQGGPLVPLSCIWAFAGEDALDVTAGPDGLELLVLQFPDDPGGDVV